MRIIDCTLPVGPDTPVWPGDDSPVVSLVCDMAEGDGINLTHFAMSAHTGTHMDAPRHFDDGGGDIAGYPLSVLVGPCFVAEVPPEAGVVTAAMLDPLVPPHCERLLVRTANSELGRLGRSGFDPAYVGLCPSAADWLVARGIQLVGIDYLSVDPYSATDFPAHRALLGAGVAVLEGCDLTAVRAGEYTLVCAPLKLAGADGAPTRVYLVEP